MFATVFPGNIRESCRMRIESGEKILISKPFVRVRQMIQQDITHERRQAL